MSNSPMPESVIIEAVDTLFNGRRQYTGFRTRKQKHEYVVDESDQQAFEQWVEQREQEIQNGREV